HCNAVQPTDLAKREIFSVKLIVSGHGRESGTPPIGCGAAGTGRPGTLRSLRALRAASARTQGAGTPAQVLSRSPVQGRGGGETPFGWSAGDVGRAPRCARAGRSARGAAA